ncbi:hypothetical protein GQ55_7G054300 [Panicum hallii var. hallii]|uniref:Uncharacterized protein n=1 Tax=Panicum hallii var. hallii TaxID=1504633 RepID=A0A2T7CSI7_9POAL|nr:hypothetical protein GQ55_7G054300 [Panicum hallii var. hallii]
MEIMRRSGGGRRSRPGGSGEPKAGRAARGRVGAGAASGCRRRGAAPARGGSERARGSARGAAERAQTQAEAAAGAGRAAGASGATERAQTQAGGEPEAGGAQVGRAGVRGGDVGSIRSGRARGTGVRKTAAEAARVPELHFSPSASSVPIAGEGPRATIGTSSGGFLQVLDP